MFTVNALHLRDPRSDKHPLLYHRWEDCQEKSTCVCGFTGEFSKTVWGLNGLNSHSQKRYPIHTLCIPYTYPIHTLCIPYVYPLVWYGICMVKLKGVWCGEGHFLCPHCGAYLPYSVGQGGNGQMGCRKNGWLRMPSMRGIQTMRKSIAR